MKKLILLLLLIIGITTCSPKLFDWQKIGIDGKMYVEYDKLINKKQLDSLCNADTLNHDINTWLIMPYYDYETKEKINQYMYIKQQDSIKEIIYIITPIQDSITYKITKRITTNNN